MNSPTTTSSVQPVQDLPPAPAAVAGPEAVPERKPALLDRHVIADQICVLTFDRPGSSANLLDHDTLSELDEHLQAVAADRQLRGLILTSAKPAIFIAGADLHSLANASSPEELRRLIEFGQAVFNRLAALSLPTIAAIHGAAVGGGYEVCLACDYRLASPDRETKIGLPETRLGLLPAWGGCTRLPRLIGLPKALDIILGGKTLAAPPALKHGLVDELVPREYLVPWACQKILADGSALRARKRPLSVLSRWPIAGLIANRARAAALRKTRGLYPALPTALRVVRQGLGTTIERSLVLEREGLVELAQTEACQNLVRVFFLQERAKKLLAGPRAEAPPPVHRLAVLGAGVMGSGIAQWVSARGLPVILRDLNPALVAKGLAAIARLYDQGRRRHLFTRTELRAGLDRIYPAADEVPLRQTDLILEAATEKMELKKEIFRRLDELAGPETVLATNTSALSISEIAAVTRHPERVVGLHFFNPVYRMQLVEVVAGTRTDPHVVRRAVHFAQRIGKLPVVVRDSPGFLVNRILMPYLLEAGRLFESGARVEDIDETMLDFGLPMGPLRLLDEVGLDVAGHVAETITAHFSPRLRTPTALARMVEEGLLGRKGGRGFYLHTHKHAEPMVNPQIDHFHLDDTAAILARQELRERMVLLVVNEAARCLEEEIVPDPADVDFAMVMGTGFAPFRGGPLRWADSTGLPELVERMNALAGTSHERFAPCALLQAMAAQGKGFYEQKGTSA